MIDSEVHEQSVDYTELFGEKDDRSEIYKKKLAEVKQRLEAAGANPQTEAFQTEANNLATELTELEISSILDIQTGLYNKRGFAKRLEEELDVARRGGVDHTILIVDLNKLKTINDQEGHQIGDEYIESAASMLKKTTRKSDIVARTGGDEFTVLLKTNQKGALRWGQRMVRNFSNTSVSLAIGSAPLDTGNPKTSIKLADERMYTAKEQSHKLGINYYFDGTAANTA